MPKKDSSDDISMAELLGKSYAHLQHGMDRMIAWGFSKMNDVQEQTEPEKDFQNPYIRTAFSVGKKAVGFLGKAGNSYFKTYEELKKNTDR